MLRRKRPIINETRFGFRVLWRTSTRSSKCADALTCGTWMHTALCIWIERQWTSTRVHTRRWRAVCEWGLKWCELLQYRVRLSFVVVNKIRKRHVRVRGISYPDEFLNNNNTNNTNNTNTNTNNNNNKEVLLPALHTMPRPALQIDVLG